MTDPLELLAEELATADPQEAPTPKRPSRADIPALARAAAERHGINPDIFERLIKQESGFNPYALSPKGARGVAQFMPETGARYGLKTRADFHDANKSLEAGARHFRDLLDRFNGDYDHALAAYNAGEGAVVKYGGVPPYRETRRYVAAIKSGAGVDHLDLLAEELARAPQASKSAIRNPQSAIPEPPIGAIELPVGAAAAPGDSSIALPSPDAGPPAPDATLPVANQSQGIYHELSRALGLAPDQGSGVRGQGSGPPSLDRVSDVAVQPKAPALPTAQMPSAPPAPDKGGQLDTLSDELAGVQVKPPTVHDIKQRRTAIATNEKQLARESQRLAERDKSLTAQRATLEQKIKAAQDAGEDPTPFKPEVELLSRQIEEFRQDATDFNQRAQAHHVDAEDFNGQVTAFNKTVRKNRGGKLPADPGTLNAAARDIDSFWQLHQAAATAQPGDTDFTRGRRLRAVQDKADQIEAKYGDLVEVGSTDGWPYAKPAGWSVKEQPSQPVRSMRLDQQDAPGKFKIEPGMDKFMVARGAEEKAPQILPGTGGTPAGMTRPLGPQTDSEKFAALDADLKARNRYFRDEELVAKGQQEDAKHWWITNVVRHQFFNAATGLSNGISGFVGLVAPEIAEQNREAAQDMQAEKGSAQAGSRKGSLLGNVIYGGARLAPQIAISAVMPGSPAVTFGVTSALDAFGHGHPPLDAIQTGLEAATTAKLAGLASSGVTAEGWRGYLGRAGAIAGTTAGVRDLLHPDTPLLTGEDIAFGLIFAAFHPNKSPLDLDPAHPPDYMKPIMRDMADVLKARGVPEADAKEAVKNGWADHLRQAKESGLNALEVRARARAFMEDYARQYAQSPEAPAPDQTATDARAAGQRQYTTEPYKAPKRIGAGEAPVAPEAVAPAEPQPPAPPSEPKTEPAKPTSNLAQLSREEARATTRISQRALDVLYRAAAQRAIKAGEPVHADAVDGLKLESPGYVKQGDLYVKEGVKSARPIRPATRGATGENLPGGTTANADATNISAKPISVPEVRPADTRKASTASETEAASKEGSAIRTEAAPQVTAPVYAPGDVVSHPMFGGGKPLKVMSVAGRVLKVEVPQKSGSRISTLSLDSKIGRELAVVERAPVSGKAQESAASEPSAVRFQTAKGSTYVLHDDGTTTRMKAKRPEHKDSGLQPRSEATYFVTREDALKLAEFQAEGAKRIIAKTRDGRIGMKYVEGKDAGKFEGHTVVTPQAAPAEGLTPVELFKGGARVHFGNEITKISGQPRQPVSELDTAAHEAATSRESDSQIARSRQAPETGPGKVLAHIAGPSGAGKTEIADALGKTVKNIALIDIDAFDDAAVKRMGLTDKPKDDFTDAELDRLHEEKQAIVDRFISRSRKPIVFFGHHIEGGKQLDLHTENNQLLDVSAVSAAARLLRRPGRKASELPEYVKSGQADIDELTGLGYKQTKPRAIFSQVIGWSRRATGPSATVDAATGHAATSPINKIPEPTEAQKDAGNYQKGHVNVGGLDIAIENPAGSKRKPGWPTLKAHYGYIKRTEGGDGEQIDVFVKEGTPLDYAGPVFVMDQQNAKGGFDEHKTMLGYSTEAEARAGYAENYTKGWEVGPITKFDSPQAFKQWLNAADTSKPAKASKIIADAKARIEAKAPTSRVNVLNAPRGKPASPAVKRVLNEKRQVERERDTDPVSELESQSAWKRAQPAVDANPNRAVIAIDLNDFKRVNDEYGHAAGDRVLKGFGDELKRLLPDAQMIARSGGDEMRVVVPVKGANFSNAHKATEVIKRIKVKEGDITVTGSAGFGATDAEADATAMKHKAELKAAGLIGERGKAPAPKTEAQAAREEIARRREAKGTSKQAEAPTTEAKAPSSTQIGASKPQVQKSAAETTKAQGQSIADRIKAELAKKRKQESGALPDLKPEAIEASFVWDGEYLSTNRAGVTALSSAYGKQARGLTLKPAQAIQIAAKARLLAKDATGEARDNLTQLATALTDAARDRHEFAVGLPRSAMHELGHVAQLALQRAFGKDITAADAEKLPHYKAIARGLQIKGYTWLKDARAIAHEGYTHVAGGQWDEIGIGVSQAMDFAAAYFGLIAETYDDAGLQRFNRLSAELENLRDEVINQRAEAGKQRANGAGTGQEESQGAGAASAEEEAGSGALEDLTRKDDSDKRLDAVRVFAARRAPNSKPIAVHLYGADVSDEVLQNGVVIVGGLGTKGDAAGKANAIIYKRFREGEAGGEGIFFRFTHNRAEPVLAAAGKLRPSRNHNAGYDEQGVSVSRTNEYGAPIVWGSEHSPFRYGYRVRGKIIGYGADGEPVLDPSSIELVDKRALKREKLYEESNERNRVWQPAELEKAGWSKASIGRHLTAYEVTTIQKPEDLERLTGEPEPLANLAAIPLPPAVIEGLTEITRLYLDAGGGNITELINTMEEMLGSDFDDVSEFLPDIIEAEEARRSQKKEAVKAPSGDTETLRVPFNTVNSGRSDLGRALGIHREGHLYRGVHSATAIDDLFKRGYVARKDELPAYFSTTSERKYAVRVAGANESGYIIETDAPKERFESAGNLAKAYVLPRTPIRLSEISRIYRVKEIARDMVVSKTATFEKELMYDRDAGINKFNASSGAPVAGEWVRPYLRKLHADAIGEPVAQAPAQSAKAAAVDPKEHWNFDRSTFTSPDVEAAFRRIVQNAVAQAGTAHKETVTFEQHRARVERMSPDLLPEITKLRDQQIVSREVFTAASEYAQTLTRQAQDLRAEITSATDFTEAAQKLDRIAQLEHDATEIMAHTVGVRSEFGRNLALLAGQKGDQLSPEKVLAFGLKLAHQRGLESDSKTWKRSARKLVASSNQIQGARKERTRIRQERKKVKEATAKPVVRREGWQARMVAGLQSSASDAIARLEARHKPLADLAPQTEPEAFKRWFGDSKVVDEYGKPLVVYHGTASGKRFEAFNPLLIGGGNDGEAGYWFTSYPQSAALYAGIEPKEWSRRMERGGFFLEPGEEEFPFDLWRVNFGGGRRVLAAFLKIESPLIVDGRGIADFREANEIASEAKATRKYDGVIFRGAHWGIDREPATNYLVFEPAQIKSATGNVGTFNPNDPNIFADIEPDTDAYDIATVLAARVAAETAKGKTGLPLDRILEDLRAEFPDVVAGNEDDIKATADSLLKSARREALSTAARNPQQNPTARAELAREAAASRRALRQAERETKLKQAQVERLWQREADAAARQAEAAWDKAIADEAPQQEIIDRELSKADRDAEREWRRQERKAIAEEAKRLRHAQMLEEQARLEAIADEARDRAKADRQAVRDAIKAGQTKEARARKLAERKTAAAARRWDYPITQAEAAARARIATVPDYQPTTDDLAAILSVKGAQPDMTPTRLHDEMKAEFGDAYSKSAGRIRDRAAEMRVEARRADQQRRLEQRAAGKAEGVNKPAEEQQARADYQAWQQDRLRELAEEEAYQIKREQAAKRDIAREFAKLQKPSRLDSFLDLLGLPISLRSSIDLPFLRQGIIPVITHPGLTYRAFITSMGTWTEAQMERKVDALERHDLAGLARASGLKQSSLETRRAPLSRLAREEQFQNRFAQRFPHVRVSERQYTIGMDSLRLALFEKLANQLMNRYRPARYPDVYEDLAREINIWTGVGDIGAITKYSPTLNRLVWSTRLIAARLEFLVTPLRYAAGGGGRGGDPGGGTGGGSADGDAGDPQGDRLPDPVRRIAIQHWLQFMGTMAGLFGVAALFGLTSLDLDDDNFLKFHPPGTNQHWDLTGGLAQYVRLFGKLVRSVYRKATHRMGFAGDGIVDNLAHFARGKLAPAPATAVDAFTGKTFTGEPFQITRPLLESFVPMAAGDIYDGIRLDGAAGFLQVPFVLLGGGSSTYRSRKMADSTGTEAERIARGLLAAKMGDKPETMAEYRRRSLITEYVAAKKAGRPTEGILKDIGKVGGQLTDKETETLSERISQTPLEHAYRYLDPDSKEKVMAAATPAEKARLEPSFDTLKSRVDALRDSAEFKAMAGQEQKEAVREMYTRERAAIKKNPTETDKELDLRHRKEVAHDEARTALLGRADFKALSEDQRDDVMRKLGMIFRPFAVSESSQSNTAKDRDDSAVNKMKLLDVYQKPGKDGKNRIESMIDSFIKNAKPKAA